MVIKFYVARTQPPQRVRINANQKVRVIKRSNRQAGGAK